MTPEEQAMWMGRVEARLEDLQKSLVELKEQEAKQNDLLSATCVKVAEVRAQARLLGAISGAISGAGAWAAMWFTRYRS